MMFITPKRRSPRAHAQNIRTSTTDTRRPYAHLCSRYTAGPAVQGLHLRREGWAGLCGLELAHKFKFVIKRRLCVFVMIRTTRIHPSTHARTDTDPHARQIMFLPPKTAPHHHTGHTQTQLQEAGRVGTVRAQASGGPARAPTRGSSSPLHVRNAVGEAGVQHVLLGVRAEGWGREGRVMGGHGHDAAGGRRRARLVLRLVEHIGVGPGDRVPSRELLAVPRCSGMGKRPHRRVMP
jgi:hypothetical protein